MRKRVYLPSETHLHLYPPNELIKCSCGVRFHSRPDNDHGEDDPALCLPCNRKSWSRLLNGNKPITIERSEISAGDVSFDLASDIDIGEVVSIKRGKR